VPWLRRLAAGLPPRRPGFDPGPVHVGFVVDKVALGQVFSPSTSVFPCQFHSAGAPLLGKGQKIIIIIIVIFITGLHNKHQGCSASVASAAGPFSTKKKAVESQKLQQHVSVSQHRANFRLCYEILCVCAHIYVYMCKSGLLQSSCPYPAS
jgi:hypothetical protein